MSAGTGLPHGPARSGALRRLLLALAAVALALTGAVVGAAPASAASDDQIEAFRIAYDLQPSGVLEVEETILWRFGSDSGRHGIQRDLVERERHREEKGKGRPDDPHCGSRRSPPDPVVDL